MKKQVVVIHGGGVFKTYKQYIAYLKNYKFNFEKIKNGDWKDALHRKLELSNFSSGYRLRVR